MMTKYHLTVHNDDQMFIEKILNHISDWGKFWFGLIFLGSIFNAILEKFTSPKWNIIYLGISFWVRGSDRSCCKD